jgi:DNA-binding MarR family transcriptional regulator
MKRWSSNNSNELPPLAGIPTYQAGVAQSTAYRLLKKFTEENLKPYDLSMMQCFIVGTIHDAGQGGITVTNLSKVVDTNVPYITNTLNLLASKGIIERNSRDDDNRSRQITINPEFEETFCDIEHKLRQQMKQVLYANLTQRELETYVHVLYKLNNAFQ